ncbi:hypothetical protein [Pelosinus sp. IPA-1]|uniref:DUF7305 domain-containing protein n=1 Tax=Pelosinus sp. IPA-1 TaxID=3029569 RepID=UPI002436212A|nr:hypothetical protein [Pelosinus sp. IPA-1]GMB00508.1 hypothetical protein PIPA1_33070 [Pelosinus sp. IPA-1]
MKSQRGSVTLLGLMTMVIGLILLSSISSMAFSAIKTGIVDHDVLQAQYAAEAGNKRIISSFNSGNTQIDNWVDSISNINWQTLNGDSKAQYHTKISYQANASMAASQINPLSAITSGIYTIESIGKVGNITKTVTTTITLKKGGNDLFSRYSVFSRGDFSIYGGSSSAPIIYDIATTGTATVNSGNKFLSGKVYGLESQPGSNTYYPNGGTDWYVQETADKIGSLEISIPKVPSTNLTNPTALPITDKGQYYNQTCDLKKDYYICDGSYLVNGISKINAISANPVVITIHGDLKLDTSASITGDKVSIYVDGDFDMANNSSISASDLRIYVTGKIHLTNSATIKANDATIQTTSLAGYALVGDNTSSIITSGNTYIYANNGGVNLTNNFTMQNSGGEVIMQGAFKIDNQVQASNTFFVSSSGESYITGSSGTVWPKTVSSPPTSIAGAYTNGSLKIDGSPIFNSQRSSIEMPGGESSSGSINVNSWSVK